MPYFYDIALHETFGLERAQRVMDVRGYNWARRIPEPELQLAEPHRLAEPRRRIRDFRPLRS